jgi:antitoxin (DNA-binding transcriptional repressor) of toxin-antitoxin stability system
MNTVTIQEAQARLPEIIRRMTPGEEVVITADEEPVAALVAKQHHARKPRCPGSERETILSMSEDFDAPLADFSEYMR